MEHSQPSFTNAFTLDDLLLIPGYTNFTRADIDLTAKLTKHISLKLPLVSSPMDTVTEKDLAIELAKLGGIGIIHRNFTVGDQADQVLSVRGKKLIVGAAVGANTGFEERAKALVAAGVSVIVVDSAHGFSKNIIDAVRYIKKHFPRVEVIAGNIATAEGARAMIDAGSDGLRVGMGPGAICTTRIISGMGVPQGTALLETVSVAQKAGVPVISDGGIKYSGDIVKALALGADAVMMGSFFAGAKEAPGETVELPFDKVPRRFHSIFQENTQQFMFKKYRGMGSMGAMKKGANIKSEDEYHGKDYKDRVLVAEGVEGLVPVRGNLKQLVDQMTGGIKSGFFYAGAKTIDELHKKACFYRITQASLLESHPHDILITNPGENY